jgi:thioredoxin-like negative regulator of GroEL
MSDGHSDTELFEKLEAELEQDGTFDYYRDQRIRSFQSDILKTENLTKRFKFYETEKKLLADLNEKEMKNGNYLLVFINETFYSCKVLTNKLKETIEKSDGNYIICLINAIESPFLVDRLKITTLPTMVAYVKGKNISTKTGLDGLLENQQDVSTVSSEKLANLFSGYFPQNS